MNKNQSKKKQFILFGVCSVLALALCMAALVVTVRRVDGNTTVEHKAEKESRTPLKGNESELVSYVKKLTGEAQENLFIKANKYTDIGMELSGETESLSENDKTLFSYIKSNITQYADTLYGEDAVGVFGEPCKVLPLVNLEKCDISDYTFSVGAADSEGNPLYDDNGALVDADYYFISFKTSEPVKGNKASEIAFGAASLPDVSGELKNELSSVCSVKDVKADFREYEISFKINRLTDEMEYMEIQRIYDVEAKLEFINELEIFGEKNVALEYKATEKFDIYYAGISFVENNITIEKGEEYCLNVSAVIEDDSEYAVTFISADEKIASVDEMGYVKALESAENPVKITVKLDYLGESFTDKCFVNIQ